MANQVFANGMEIACKAGAGKVIASFPDVCMSPPPPPAGPVPIPYPNSSFSKDMKKGSKKVKINGSEVMLKDQSFYKSSPLGNEAATKSFGSGVITHVITGKTYFVAWSMDVKFEGKNVDRHLDFTTSNHASPIANAQLPLPGLEKMIMSPEEKEKHCKELHDEKDRICGDIPVVIYPKNPKKWLEKLTTKKKLPLSRRDDLCKKTDSRIKAFEDCLSQRQLVTDECFGGVTDPVHERQEKAVRSGLEKTKNRKNDFCTGLWLPL